MPRVTLRMVFLTIAVVVAAVQLGAVTLAAIPPNRYSNAVAPHTGYLNPFFTQDWRLFAPNPVAEDRSISFQGSYVTADGTIKKTPWVDWTAVELDLIHHRLVGGRAGYVTNKLSTPLGGRFGALSPGQQQVAHTTDVKAPPSWLQLRTLLDAAGPNPGEVLIFLRYERAAARLGTDVLEARWPGRRFTAVRYSLRQQGVVPYASRHESSKERSASRPAVIQRLSGWRAPSAGPDDERHAIADFYRRHR